MYANRWLVLQNGHQAGISVLMGLSLNFTKKISHHVSLSTIIAYLIKICKIFYNLIKLHNFRTFCLCKTEKSQIIFIKYPSLAPCFSGLIERGKYQPKRSKTMRNNENQTGGRLQSRLWVGLRIYIKRSVWRERILSMDELIKINYENAEKPTVSGRELHQALEIKTAFDLPAYIAKEFARRIGTKEEEAFLIGDGKGKPTGIFANTGGAEVGATAGAAITFDDVIELFYSLKSPYRKKAVWIMNEQTIKVLRKLKDSTGNYIWQPSVTVGQPDTILNRPYVTSVYAPALAANQKPIAFGDFSYYWIADRQGRSMKRLNELFAMNGQIGFLASQRVDGKLILPEAVKVLSIKKSS
ncbi:MAG: phage major capsid protein [Oscillospiraceae bacterium]